MNRHFFSACSGPGPADAAAAGAEMTGAAVTDVAAGPGPALVHAGTTRAPKRHARESAKVRFMVSLRWWAGEVATVYRAPTHVLRRTTQREVFPFVSLTHVGARADELG